MPPNWSSRDWQEEMRCLADETAWQAARDYGCRRGLSLASFVRGRVLAAALAHYRHEWTYAYHSGTYPSDLLASGTDSDGHSADRDGLLLFAMIRLPDNDRWILEQLCLMGRTEAEVGRDLGITHQAVSRRKQHALALLRSALASFPEP